jgi:hypothetical protein
MAQLFDHDWSGNFPTMYNSVAALLSDPQTPPGIVGAMSPGSGSDSFEQQQHSGAT